MTGISNYQEIKTFLQEISWKDELLNAQVPAIGTMFVGGLCRLASAGYAFGLVYPISKAVIQKIMKPSDREEAIDETVNRDRIVQYGSLVIASAAAMILGASLIHVLAMSMIFGLLQKFSILDFSIKNQQEETIFSYGQSEQNSWKMSIEVKIPSGQSSSQ
ncbi:MAG: hypothetical protein JW769_03690 [Parachlamydiales bacterium]|nr:hypothetical protein [Parachlamydiales bacterium]